MAQGYNQHVFECLALGLHNKNIVKLKFRKWFVRPVNRKWLDGEMFKYRDVISNSWAVFFMDLYVTSVSTNWIKRFNEAMLHPVWKQVCNERR